MRAWTVLAAVAAALLTGGTARAEWLRATTPHFVIYADTSDRGIRTRALALEQSDWVMRRFLGMDDPKELSANPVTVFVTSQSMILKLCRCENVSGFYNARVGGAVAFSASDAENGWGDGDMSRIILLHEYAHHFMLGSFDASFPTWFTEGFAEFVSTMRMRDGRMLLGIAAQHRAYGLLEGTPLTSRKMFDPAPWGTLKGAQFDAFYGRGWLMTHYFAFKPARWKQMKAYLVAVEEGKPGVEAAEAAFGDLKVLDRELDRYLNQNGLPGLPFPIDAMPAPAIAVEKVGAGAAALMRLRMESVRGVDDKTAPALYAKAAPIAARYPDDAVAQGWLAEMAYDAGEDAASAKAAARATELDGKSIQGLLYSARVRLRALEKANSTDAAAWTAARRPIIDANHLVNDDAEPLWLFWQSFAMEGRTPTKSAMAGLYRAQMLVPQDGEVRYAAAVARVQAGEKDEAKALLRVAASDPHAPADNPARRMLAALDAGKTGDAVLKAAGEGAAK